MVLEVFNASITEWDGTGGRFDLVGFLCILFASFEKLKLKINMSQNSWKELMGNVGSQKS